MGYRGQTYQILCNRGGLNNSRNTDLIQPFCFVSPSSNINLHEGGWRKRGGTAKVNETAVSGSPRGMGGFDFQLSNTSYQVFMGKDGKLYKDPTTTLKTGMSTSNYASFDVFGNELFVCDGDTTPQTWDGSAGSTSNITTPAADWSGANQPFQCVTHGRGTSRRVWYLFGNAVYYSSLNNGKEVSGGTSGKITIDTPDAAGLVGMTEWQNRLFVFSRNKTYIINDIDDDPAFWGYEQAAWTGGAAHWRLLVKTPNDLVVMDRSGEIYSIAAVQSYGDYKRASLARPAFIDNYIRDNVRLGFIEDFHAIYDPVKRAIEFFVVRNGKTTIDTALVYFIDRPPEEAWSIHNNKTATSGYSASCSFLVETSTGVFTVYTIDYSGFIWKLEQTNRNDDGAGYYAGVRLANIPFDNPRIQKHFKRGRVVLASQGNHSIQVRIWVDGLAKNGTSISVVASGTTLGSFVLGTDLLGTVLFLDQPFDLGYYGKRLQLEFYNSSVNQDFFFSQILIDYKNLSAAP